MCIQKLTGSQLNMLQKQKTKRVVKKTKDKKTKCSEGTFQSQTPCSQSRETGRESTEEKI